MIPFIQISYLKKAPAFANIDNIEEKFQKHFGRFYEKAEDYIKILKQEENYEFPGYILSANDGKIISKVSLDDEKF